MREVEHKKKRRGKEVDDKKEEEEKNPPAWIIKKLNSKFQMKTQKRL